MLGSGDTHRVEAADAVQAGGGQDDLVEHGDRAADQARVAALGDHCQPPFVAVRQHLQGRVVRVEVRVMGGVKIRVRVEVWLRLRVRRVRGRGRWG